MLPTEKQYHIKCGPGDVGRYVFLPGDPGRVEKMAAFLEDARPIAYNREYNTYSGYLCGEKVSICSTGIGGPSASIAMVELHAIGADTFIRVGTCGGIRLDVMPGDVVIATGAVRYEHTSMEFAPIEFPAVPDLGVTNALADAAGRLGYEVRTGVVQCKDSFYGQHCPEQMPVDYELMNKWHAWKRLGVLASEMESAALFVVASSLGCRCGSCFSVVWNQEREKEGLSQEPVEDPMRSIKVGIEGMKNVILRDQEKAKKQ